VAVAKQPPQPEATEAVVVVEQPPRLEPGPAVREQQVPVENGSVQLEPYAAGCKPGGVEDRPVQAEARLVEGPGQSGGWSGPQRAPPDELDDAAAQRQVATERPLQCVSPTRLDLQENPESLAARWWSQIEREMWSRRRQRDGR
jgi:hypothetical protein